MSVPNQSITKTKKTKPQKDFLIISNEDWMAASRNLTPSGFQMYLWLIRHDESFNNELSKQAFIKDFNASGSSYDRAWKELKDKKYAIQKEKGSNIYYSFTHYKPSESLIEKFFLGDGNWLLRRWCGGGLFDRATIYIIYIFIIYFYLTFLWG